MIDEKHSRMIADDLKERMGEISDVFNLAMVDLVGKLDEAFGDSMHSIYVEIATTQERLQQPHVLMKAKVYKDGDKWCCLYGDNIEEGVAGFGDTPEEACTHFDNVWHEGFNISGLSSREGM